MEPSGCLTPTDVYKSLNFETLLTYMSGKRTVCVNTFCATGSLPLGVILLIVYFPKHFLFLICFVHYKSLQCSCVCKILFCYSVFSLYFCHFIWFKINHQILKLYFKDLFEGKKLLCYTEMKVVDLWPFCVGSWLKGEIRKES